VRTIALQHTILFWLVQNNVLESEEGLQLEMPARDLLIGDVFRSASRSVPGRVAAALDGAELTFSALDAGANSFGRALAARGVGRGDRVVVWSATNLDTLKVFAGAAKIGAVFTPLSSALTAGEAAPVAAAVRPAVLVFDPDRAEAAQQVAHRAGAAAVGLADLAVAAAQEDAAADLSCGQLREDDPHVIFFTSGSTGRPKGVVISHRVSYLRTHPGALLEPRGAMVCPYPLFHMGAWTIALQQWQARDRVVLLSSVDPAVLGAAIQDHRATRLNCIPAIWRRLLDHVQTEEGRSVDLSSVRVADAGTSATPVELLEAIRAALPNANLRVFYGSTEAGPVAMLEDRDVARKPGSCGVVVPTADVRLDGTGEVWVRGPLLFDGYYDDPTATAEAVVDGWYRTGDLAEVDDEGYLTIVGRARDVIRTGGETVSPLEVEQVLTMHPQVADVAVVGLPDAQWGEVVCAVVVPADGAAPPGLSELQAHCAGQLARFKHPRRLAVVDTLPRTASTNQVQRRLLAERLG
jgi:fatty-acyl-CoA synthase